MYNDIILLDFLGFSTCFWKWFLCSLGSFLLGWLLHWLFFSAARKRRIAELEEEVRGLRAKLTDVEKDHASLKYQYDESQKEIARLQAALNRCEGDKLVLKNKLDAGDGNTGIIAGAPVPVPTGDNRDVDYAAVLGNDNLQIVEGIGPKIEGLLKADGINTWADLGNASQERLQGILTAAGSRYQMHKPDTWAQQAKLAAEGKFDELIALQKDLDGGKAEGLGGTDSKLEKLLAKKLGFSTNPEDLKIVEGIGPKIEGLLKADGINNWTDLANASVDRLQGILTAAGDRYKLATPDTWPKQAELAAAGKWGELSDYQDFLDGGKDRK